MLKAIDAGQQRRFKKLRVKVVRALIIVLTLAAGSLGYHRYQEMQLWRAFNQVTDSFIRAHNEAKPGEFYDAFADDGLKAHQTRQQFINVQTRIQSLLGPIDDMKLIEFKQPTADKPFHILVYRFRHAGKAEGRISIALKWSLKEYKLYAWKIQAQALK